MNTPLWPYLREIDARAGARAISLPLLSVSQSRGVGRFAEFFDKDPRAEDHGSYKLVRKGDIVLNRMSANKGAVGIASEAGITSPDYMVLRPLDGMDARFAVYLFKSSLGLFEVTRSLRGIGTAAGSNVRTPRISAHELLRIKWPLLDHQTQNRIADYLDHETAEIDGLVENQRILIDLTNERLKAKRFNLATGGSTTLPARSQFWPQLPKGWTLQKLGWHFWSGNGSTPSTSRLDYWETDHGTPWVNSSVVNLASVTKASRYVSEIALRECHLPMVPAGSLLVGLTGQGKTRGMVSRLNLTTTINQHLAYLTPKSTSDLSIDFTRVALEAAYPYLRFISDGNGGTKGAITTEILKQFQVPVPPADVQDQVVGRMTTVQADTNEVVSDARALIALAQERRAALISAAVTGQIDVTERRRGPSEAELLEDNLSHSG